MYKIVTIRTDYEGWWLFDDWKDYIIKEIECHDYEDMVNQYHNLLNQYQTKFTNELVGKHNIHAFYNNCDLSYCEDCEEDMQIFYSILILNDNSIYTPLPK